MERKVIKIDEEKCIGCGLCASTCKEGAIDMVDGKAKLMREDYCDGFGNCLPVCPTEAISFESGTVHTAQVKKTEAFAGGCPGIQAKAIERESSRVQVQTQIPSSHLNQWPVQIKLVAPNAPYFEDANLLIAADCSAYAYGNFHEEYMKNRVTIIGCPKLDACDYSEKLTAILKNNSIKSVTIVRMEVPCCSGIESATKLALQNCAKMIPWQVVTISTDGRILEN